MGQLIERKGFDAAITSFQALLKRFPSRDFRLLVIGEGPCERDLKALAQRSVAENRVIFSPFTRKPWELLNVIDVFVMPSRNEGLPLALLEAMACGCCPVATAVGGIPEVLNSPELGWLVASNDGDALTEAMVDAASRTAEQLAVMGSHGREHIRANFSAAVQFNLLADSVVERPRG
jgi:glycosyltransferase involved in cell wall biosynthesis